MMRVKDLQHSMPVRSFNQGTHRTPQRTLTATDAVCFGEGFVKGGHREFCSTTFGKANSINALGTACFDTEPTFYALVHVPKDTGRGVIM
jgi:hypothetical protein